eukprot:SAG31_NODE_8177_length_1502_cov_0.991447_1_plen_57_part_10
MLALLPVMLLARSAKAFPVAAVARSDAFADLEHAAKADSVTHDPATVRTAHASSVKS